MTANERLELAMTDWLHDDAARRVPDHLDEVLATTSTTRQRPAWSSPERWLPVDTAFRPRLFQTPRLGQVVLVGAIILALLGALLLYAGSRQPHLPPPFGLARNGPELAWSSGDIVQTQADGTWRPLIGGPDDDLAPIPTRDGTRMSFLRSVDEHTVYLMVANIDGSAVRQVLPDRLTDADWFEWSADGRQLAMVNSVRDMRTLTIVDVDGGTTTNLDLGDLSVDNDVFWLPPDGSRLIFTAQPNVKDSPRAIYTVRPDGTDLTPVSTAKTDQASYLGVDVAPDGKTVSFWNYETDPSGIGDSSHVHFLDLATGQDQRVTFDSSAIGETDLHFSPDGIHVVLQHETTEAQLEIATRDRTGPTLLVGPKFSVDADANYGFTPDGKTVFLAFSFAKPYYFDVATGAQTRGAASIESFAGYTRLAP